MAEDRRSKSSIWALGVTPPQPPSDRLERLRFVRALQVRTLPLVFLFLILALTVGSAPTWIYVVMGVAAALAVVNFLVLSLRIARLTRPR